MLIDGGRQCMRLEGGKVGCKRVTRGMKDEGEGDLLRICLSGGIVKTR